VIVILIAMNVWSALIVPFVLAIDKHRWRPKSWLWVYIPYQLTMLTVPSVLTVQYGMPPASGLAVMCEMVRADAGAVQRSGSVVSSSVALPHTRTSCRRDCS
jgi:hypothetical protein